MSELENQNLIYVGSSFIINQNIEIENIFIPEEFSAEEKMMAESTQDFIDKEYTPFVEKIENLDYEVITGLIEKAGELGLLGLSVSSKYGGMGMGLCTSLLIADIFGSTGSFSTTYGAHTGIATLPIYYYGTEEQKQKYLPLLISGKWKGSYCLTEPNAGSDANAGKTKAALTADKKHYLINGEKIWISNAGFADLFIVFAKIDNDSNHSAFIVEKTYPGITMNEEEKKLGIKGSSTRQVFFTDCKVPVENLLYERGAGLKIALNVLNIGRIKLGVGVINGNKKVITQCVKYANERKQFGQPISSFGAIKYKLAQMTILNYAIESISYRAGKRIDDLIDHLIQQGEKPEVAKLKGTEEFAIEAAIIKIFGSEILSYIVDEGVQIFGGMGFSEDLPMARAYRDARITRIYEGTNEINRLLIVDMLIKRALKGRLDLLSFGKEVTKELMTIGTIEKIDSTSPLAKELHIVNNLKKVVIMALGKATETFGAALEHEQEIIMNISDMVIQVYTAESCLLRAKKVILKNNDEARAELFKNMSICYLMDSVRKVRDLGEECIFSFVKNEELTVMSLGLKKFTKIDPINTKDLRRKIAETIINKNEFPYNY